MMMMIKTYVYKIVDFEQQLEADVHYCTTNPACTAPIALVFHRGAFCTSGREHVPRNQLETLLELGFIVVSVDYRLCPTISLCDGPVTDCMDCYVWCKSVLPDLLQKDTRVLIDPRRLVTMGHSAGGTLALLMSTNPDPPLAILDFYGGKYFSDNFWHTPNLSLPEVDFPEEFINKIWSEAPPPTNTLGLIHQSEIVDQATTIDLLQPRKAWMLSTVGNGTLMKLMVKDGNYDRIDPSTFFTENFPPVFFIHGIADKVIPVRFTEIAKTTLMNMGVVAESRLVDGQDHAFDEKITRDDANFAVVLEGLEFLAKYAKAGSHLCRNVPIAK